MDRDFDEEIFELRMKRSAGDLWPMVERLYGDRADYRKFAKALEESLRNSWAERPRDLKRLDLARDLEPDWFQRSDLVGYACYPDRFAGSLKGILDRLDYLQDLGVSYVHLMSMPKPRKGDNDGGYSVEDYRAINPDFGTMADFEAVTAAFRERGISTCVDLVLNHTAYEHGWAKKARKGVKKYQDYYLMFDDRTLPDAYERTLVEVFPETAPGSFTRDEETGKWVWTTFNTHQWDLNWANPWVFLEIVEIMLFLANKGVDVMRMDAVAFMWKRMGTRCQSEPEVHVILHALRAASRIAAPAMIHLEEAIVSPREMLPYLGQGEHSAKEGNLAYHNSLMVQFWSAIASRDTRLMTHVMGSHFPPALPNATYATYVRCHDDIGWAITDEDASALGIGGQAHRSYLSDFYEGVHPHSFARGVLFGHNPKTGDKRISGSFASLAGLERAMDADDQEAIDLAVNRILMGNALIACYGGIPLIYMGDELGLINDYGYVDRPAHAADSRWVHRPVMDWDLAEARHSDPGPAGRIFRGTQHIMARRRAVAALHGANPTEVVDTGHAEIFAVARRAPTGTVLGVLNFTERWLRIDEHRLFAAGVTEMHDLLSNAAVQTYDGAMALPPYGRVWLS